MKYLDIRPNLNTGDIVLFSGKGGFSAGIKWATNSKWSHVGMVLKLDEYDFVTLWEATPLKNVMDLDTKSYRPGVQIVPLSERIKEYDGEIAIRKLENYKLKKKSKSKLMLLRNELKGKPYERNELELVRSSYDGVFGRNSEDLSTIFCSELVAEAYQCLGLISNNIPSNEFTPSDFSSEVRMQLFKGYLSVEIYIE